MSNVLKVKVPIVMSRDNDGFWLHAENKQGHAAMIFLGALAEGIVRDVFNDWAAEQLVAAYVHNRRKTGRKDSTGQDIHEGDIIRRDYNEHYGNVVGTVKWDSEKAAFIAQGAFKDGGGGWGTLNLEEAHKWVVIGNIFVTPELLQPAKQINA